MIQRTEISKAHSTPWAFKIPSRHATAYTAPVHESDLYSHADGIDAIQLEIGFNFRSGSAWEQTSSDLASAAQRFHNAFLPSSEPPGAPALSNTGVAHLVALLLLAGSQLLRPR